jgi:hypothetical protein
VAEQRTDNHPDDTEDATTEDATQPAEQPAEQDGNHEHPAPARHVEITGEMVLVALCVILAIWFAIQAITTYTGFDSLGRGLLMVAGAAAVIVIAKAAGPSLASGRYVKHHVHAHAEGGETGEQLRRLIATHEAGHAVAVEDSGGKVLRARVFRGNSGGIVEADLPHGSREEVITASVSFLMAGRLAVGTDEGASWDMKAEDRELRRLPHRDRDRVRADATAMAEQALARNSGKLQRYADRLDRRGRL